MAVLTLPRPDALSVRAKAFVFEDTKSRALLRSVERLAPSDTTVLVVGETGTGKEIVARAPPRLSPRASDRSSRSTAARCPSALESELFGHERGAFTGADTRQARAGSRPPNGGTLFLDEIGELSPAAQVKLLRVLQEARGRSASASRARGPGRRAPGRGDQRATSSRRGRRAASARTSTTGSNVASLTLPPLRERPDDILPLARHFLELYGQRWAARPATLTPEALEALLATLARQHPRARERRAPRAPRRATTTASPTTTCALTTLQPKGHVGTARRRARSRARCSSCSSQREHAEPAPTYRSLRGPGCVQVLRPRNPAADRAPCSGSAATRGSRAG